MLLSSIYLYVSVIHCKTVTVIMTINRTLPTETALLISTDTFPYSLFNNLPIYWEECGAEVHVEGGQIIILFAPHRDYEKRLE